MHVNPLKRQMRRPMMTIFLSDVVAMTRRFWTDAELDVMRREYADTPTAELAAKKELEV